MVILIIKISLIWIFRTFFICQKLQSFSTNRQNTKKKVREIQVLLILLVSTTISYIFVLYSFFFIACLLSVDKRPSTSSSPRRFDLRKGRIEKASHSLLQSVRAKMGTLLASSDAVAR